MEHVRKFALRYGIGALFVATIFILLTVFHSGSNGKLIVAFLDVGQGDAIFIQAPSGNQLLIDGGNGGQVLRALSRVMPFYDRSIDVVLATHPDQDHIGGLVDVLNRFEIDTVFRSGAVNDTSVYRALNEAVSKSHAEQILARRGMRIVLDEDVVFEILFPDRDVSAVEPNSSSIAGRLVYGENEFLLTGDAPKSLENYLLSLDGKKLQSDVLKAGHHGSNTSSGELFVSAVAPEYAIISAGKDNRYGHPHKEVLDLFSKLNIPVISTMDHGDIVFLSDGETLEIK